MERTIIAYVLIALLVLLTVGSIWYRSYHSRDRSYRRSLKLQRQGHEKRMAARAADRAGAGDTLASP